MRNALGEVHLADRQILLRQRGERLAREIVTSAQPALVLLAGSVARGPVDLGSDIDIYVIGESAAVRSLPPWRFTADGVIENIHVIRQGEIEKADRILRDLDAISEWYCTTSLGDELYGSEVLHCEADVVDLVSSLQRVLARRLDAEVVARLASKHALTAWGLAASSEACVERGEPLESQRLVRAAAQRLLICTLVRVGWIVRGSKKRPEIAQAYSNDRGVREALALLCDIMGLSGLTASKAETLCRRRLLLRGLTIAELEHLCDNMAVGGGGTRRLIAELSRQRQHNIGAIDYYRPLVDSGYHGGVINHIRALSGFKDLPRLFMSALGSSERPGVDAFMASRMLSSEMRYEWAGIAQLYAIGHLLK